MSRDHGNGQSHTAGPSDFEKQLEREMNKVKVQENHDDDFETLLKTAADDSHMRPKTQEGLVRRRGEEVMDSIAADDENLGENFQVTPWLPPTIEKAEQFKRDSIFRNGDVRLDSVEIVSAPDLGSGVTLYFQFAVTMAICLFVMSLLALPELIFVYSGTSVSLENQVRVVL
jgi:hypothetical protein